MQQSHKYAVNPCKSMSGGNVWDFYVRKSWLLKRQIKKNVLMTILPVLYFK